MNALRQIQQVTSGSIHIDLPADFKAKTVEIIILPADEANSNGEDLQELLLAAPTITDEDFNEFKKVREWMNKWDINAF